MATEGATHRSLAVSTLPVVVTVLQETTTEAETGTEGLLDYWPLLARAGWFLLVAFLVGAASRASASCSPTPRWLSARWP